MSDEHRHDFRPTRVADAHGALIPGARRCSCGIEVTAGPMGVNVNLIRAGQRFNDALGRAMTDLARALKEGGK